MSARKSHDAHGRLVFGARRAHYQCERCGVRMTGAEIFDRRFHTGFCTCGGIVARVPVGRPPRADKAATERIEIRVTRLERAAWEHAAAQVGISASEWIRRCCATEIRPLKEFPP